MDDAFGQGTGDAATVTLGSGGDGSSGAAGSTMVSGVGEGQPPVPQAVPAPSEPAAEPDLRSEVESLRQRLDEVAPAQQESAGDQVDIVDALTLEDEGTGDDGTSVEDTDSADDELSRLADAIEGDEERNEMRERLEALEADREAEREQRRQADLRDLAQEFPELTQKPVITAVAQRTMAAAERYGDARLANDPFMVRMAYMAYKAETIAANETPAQPGSGAPVETDTGTSAAPTGSAADDVVGAMLSAGGQADAFTGG